MGATAYVLLGTLPHSGSIRVPPRGGHGSKPDTQTIWTRPESGGAAMTPRHGDAYH